MKLSERTQAVLFAAVLLASISGLWVAVKAMRPSCDAGGTLVTTLQVRGEGWSDTATVTAHGCTAYDQLESWASSSGTALESRPFGEPLNAKMVQSIGDDANGEGGRFWQFWVNCVYATAGADLTVLKEGDSVHWLFVPDPWEGPVC